ncbi:MAG: hypothetical protein IJS29_00800 [Selenomonadaceae bacterium]|nr:hypothetical protein [Selenomonadaceae bacterium]
MKGIPIKFRIKTDNNEDLYLTPSLNGDYDQLIGYDVDGAEVYEGDKLILGSHEYIAGIRPVSYTDDKKYYKPEKDFSNFLLKEV